MATERTRRGKLTQLMADHFVGHIHTDVDASVMNEKRVSNELRSDGTASSPGLNWILGPRGLELLDFGEQPCINIRPFF